MFLREIKCSLQNLPKNFFYVKINVNYKICHCRQVVLELEPKKTARNGSKEQPNLMLWFRKSLHYLKNCVLAKTENWFMTFIHTYGTYALSF